MNCENAGRLAFRQGDLRQGQAGLSPDHHRIGGSLLAKAEAGKPVIMWPRPAYPPAGRGGHHRVMVRRCPVAQALERVEACRDGAENGQVPGTVACVATAITCHATCCPGPALQCAGLCRGRLSEPWFFRGGRAHRRPDRGLLGVIAAPMVAPKAFPHRWCGRWGPRWSVGC